MTFHGVTKREGLYSPITQNRRHLELIRRIRSAEKNLILRHFFEKNFYRNYRSIVVLSNPKTILNARYAPKEVRDQVIRADQIAEFIRKTDAARPKDEMSSEASMLELAKFFRSIHKPQYLDVTEPYQRRLVELQDAAPSISGCAETTAGKDSSAPPIKVQPPSEEGDCLLCPKCGAKMIRRKATKGERAGREFYACSRFPHCRSIVNLD